VLLVGSFNPTPNPKMMKTEKEMNTELSEINCRPITSAFWRVRVDATQEEQVFDTYGELVEWCEGCRRTFMDSSMTFTATYVQERSGRV
jgi:hypothetical protein